MTSRAQAISDSLRGLAEAISAAAPNENTLLQTYGWNHPPLDGRALAILAEELADRVEQVDDAVISKGFKAEMVTTRVDQFRSTTLPYIWNGNGTVAVPAYIALLDWIDALFYSLYPPRVDWQKLADDGMLPKAISAKLRAYQSAIKRFDVDFSTLAEKITNINQAHEAANELPTDLEALRSATEEVAEVRATAQKNKVLSDEALKKVQELLSSIESKEREATKLLENTEDAYSAATTKGLGEAFQKRADRLAKSMWTWVVGLVLALAMGALLGAHRVGILQDLLSKEASDAKIALNLLLSLVVVAAPIWFAWIATKQIGHRFRLSEDYAFKASVAQAYEGYRREAARLDDAFAKRLFGSALDRIDEAPIRFVEHETHGSPWHELFGSRRRQLQRKQEESRAPIEVPRATTGISKVNGTASEESRDSE